MTDLYQTLVDIARPVILCEDCETRPPVAGEELCPDCRDNRAEGMPLPKLQEQRELERIESSIQARIAEKERELVALHETLEAVQDAISVTRDASRKYYGRQPL